MLINKLWCFLFSRHHNKYIISIDVFDIYSYPILMFKFVVTGFCLLFNGWSRATAQKIPGALQERTRSLQGWIIYFIDLWQCCMFMTYWLDPPQFLIQVLHLAHSWWDSLRNEENEKSISNLSLLYIAGGIPLLRIFPHT